MHTRLSLVVPLLCLADLAIGCTAAPGRSPTAPDSPEGPASYSAVYFGEWAGTATITRTTSTAAVLLPAEWTVGATEAVTLKVTETEGHGWSYGIPYLVGVTEARSGTDCDFLGKDLGGRMSAHGFPFDDEFQSSYWPHRGCDPEIDTSSWSGNDNKVYVDFRDGWLTANPVAGSETQLQGELLISYRYLPGNVKVELSKAITLTRQHP